MGRFKEYEVEEAYNTEEEADKATKEEEEEANKGEEEGDKAEKEAYLQEVSLQRTLASHLASLLRVSRTVSSLVDCFVEISCLLVCRLMRGMKIFTYVGQLRMKFKTMEKYISASLFLFLEWVSTQGKR